MIDFRQQFQAGNYASLFYSNESSTPASIPGPAVLLANAWHKPVAGTVVDRPLQSDSVLMPDSR